MENRDDIIRNQMETIGNLINNALKNLSEEQFGPSYEKPVEERDDKIIPFPINRRT